MLNVAVFAPSPRASVVTAIALNAGAFGKSAQRETAVLTQNTEPDGK